MTTRRRPLLALKALDPLPLPVENVVSLVTMLEQAGSQAQLEEPGASLADWLAARRFGPPVADRLAPLLNELSDPGRIAAVADAVIECETAEDLLARAEKA